MIFHISIAADDPERTARMMAELWQGRAYPFPLFGEGSWVTLACDDRNSAIEVYQRGTEIHAGETSLEPRTGLIARHGPSHAAIATPLGVEAVLDIAKRHDIIARVSTRGTFDVVEFWVDNTYLFEVLTPEMQADYLENQTVAGWEQFLEQHGFATA